MSDLITKKDYDKFLSPYVNRVSTIENELSLLLLDNIQFPKSGERWKREETKIHLLYEKLYNLSVDALEKNIDKVNLMQLSKLHTYVTDMYRGKNFQFSTPKEIKAYAENKIIELDTKYSVLVEQGKISPEVQKAIAGARKDYQKLFANSEKKYKRIIALAQSTGLDEVTVEAMYAEGLAQGKISSIQTAVNHLTAGQLVGVVGKDGITRNYKPSYIVNSLSRDIFHTQQAENTRNIIDEYGFQLIRISTHNTRTELCQYYEGGTFAKDEKSSKATGFPVLDMDTPFHYGCLHNMLPEDYDFLKMKGEIDETKAFSKNLVSSHKNNNPKEITLKPVYPKGYTKPSTRPTMPLKQEIKTKKEIASLQKKLPKVKDPKLREAIDKKILIRENRLKAGGVV